MRSTRRQFVGQLAGVGAGVGVGLGLSADSLAAALPEIDSTQAQPGTAILAGTGFPADDYTPFGYLDNPYHSWALHPSGVVRSLEGMGFGFYYPAGPGGYFDFAHNGVYTATLELQLDPPPSDARLVARHHSKDIVSYQLQAGSGVLEATFLLVEEDTLAARVEIHAPFAEPVRILARNQVRLGGAGWWGRDGLAASYDGASDTVTTRSFAAGWVFRLAASRASTAHSTGPTAYYPDPIAASLSCHAGDGALWFWLTRATNVAGARRVQRRARAIADDQLAAKRASDDRFWSRAPKLSGDWPEHWRRGWVYDFETLRMMVRRPLGAYHHRWDAMQIQAPRNVLAETSLDMWALSYADPDTAREVALAQFDDTFAASELANVPCMREDGSMNMVAADGEPCGTSIAWCYPLWCLASLAARHPEPAWLERLYPALDRFARWTLAHRRDAGGYLVGKCSWETGMDASARFQIQQPTGAELITFIRVVELQAAMAHAGATLSALAAQLKRPAEAAHWQSVADDFRQRTASLWNGRDWFEDFDTRSGRAIVPQPGHREVGQAAPVFLGVATAAQARAMVPRLREYPSHPSYYLEWPSLVLPYLESLWTAGERALAAEVVHDIAERVYRSTDRRDLHPGGTHAWPGVACEMWSLQGAAGGEGYGWGATLPAHIIRSVVGYRDDRTLHPSLPDAFMQPGRRYTCGNITYEVADATHVRVGQRLLRNHEDSMPWNDGLS